MKRKGKVKMNPVFQYTNFDDKWYFWDESWTKYYGPFDFEENAHAACVAYAEYLQTGLGPWKNIAVASNVRWRNF